MVHGADVGWVSWLESRGFRWVNDEDEVTDPLVLLQQMGVDSARLRVMVDPDIADGMGFADPARVVSMARRCADRGLKLMVDFHFSDTWADPAKQFVPRAWAHDTLEAMRTHLADHVTDVLGALKAAGVTPDWVQLGNEIPNGLLWGTEGVSGAVKGDEGWDTLVKLLNAGYTAVKAFDPRIPVIVHLDRGYDNELYRWWFDHFRAAGGCWDIVGLSFYPFWQPEGTVDQLQANLHDLVTRYGKPVMVCEVGGRADDAPGTARILTDVRAALGTVPGHQGLGVFYWEPASAPEVVGGYALGACEVVGPQTLRFTPAMRAI